MSTPVEQQSNIGWKTFGILCLLLLAYLVMAQVQELQRIERQTTDFKTLYHATMIFSEGGDPYTAIEGFYYPPTFALLFRPMTWIPIAAASCLWFAMKLILMAWTLTACYRLLQAGQQAQRLVFAFGLLGITARFWLLDIQYGNVNVMIWSLVIASIYWDRNGRNRTAGSLHAIAISAKVVPLVQAGYFLGCLRLRTLGWMITATLLLNLGPVLFMGGSWLQSWKAYLDAGVMMKLNSRLDQPDNQSLWGALNRLLNDMDIEHVRAIWLTLNILLISIALLVAWRSRRQGPDHQLLAASLFPLVGLMVSPGSWVVHYGAALLPLAVLWRFLLGLKTTLRLATDKSHVGFWIVFILVNLVFTGSALSRWSVHVSIEKSLFVLAALLLFSALAILSWRPVLWSPCRKQ